MAVPEVDQLQNLAEPIQARQTVEDLANRLGTNSLLDLVVFGRAAALRASESIKPGASQAPLPPKAGEASLDRFDRTRHAKGGTRVAELRLELDAGESEALVLALE